MSILIPVVSTGITLNEVPGKVAFYAEIGECTARCPGCHSEHLWCPVANKMTLATLLAKTIRAKDQGADAVVLMGGTTNGIPEETLQTIINALSGILPVCLYSGRDDTLLDTKLLLESKLTWLKTGSYKHALGGLQSTTTNQRFYEKVGKTVVDKTRYFLC